MVLRGGQATLWLQRKTGLPQAIHNRSADLHDGGRWNDLAMAKQGHMWLIGGEDAEHKGTIFIMDPDRGATPADSGEVQKR